MKNLKKIEVVSLIVVILTWLTILNLYFSFNNETKELRLKIEKLTKEVETSSNFSSLIYSNYAEPIFVKSANDVDSLLKIYFDQGGVQITQSRYETIQKIVNEAKSKITNIAPLSEETKNFKKQILDYYDEYLLDLKPFIGLTKDELDKAKKENSELYKNMQDLKNKETQISAFFRLITERYR